MESTFDSFQHIQQRIDHDRIWFCVSIASIAIGLILIVVTRIDLESDLLSRVSLLLGVFMLVFGCMFAWQLWKQIEYSVEHYHELNRAQLSAYRLANHLPLPAYEVENIQAHQPEPAAPLTPISVITETRNNSTSVTWEIEQHPDRPNRDFIRHIFLSKEDNGLIPTERSLQAEGKRTGLWNTSQANRWLDIFDQAQITTKVYQTENGNSRRCLKQGITLKEILDKFKYPIDQVSP